MWKSAVIFSVLLLAACGDMFEPQTVSAYLSGTVLGAGQTAVEGARIRVALWIEGVGVCEARATAPEWGKTGADGSYRLLLQAEGATEFCLGIRFEPPAESGLLPKDTVLTSVTFQERAPLEYTVHAILQPQLAPSTLGSRHF